MNNHPMAFKLKLYALAIIALVVFVIIYSSMLIYNKNSFYPTVNKGRILTNSIKTNLEIAFEKGDFSGSMKSDFPCVAADLSGKVLYSTVDKYKNATTLNLRDFVENDNKASQEESGIIKYTCPLIVNNNQVGTAAFFIPDDRFLTVSPGYSTFLNLMPILLALLVLIILTSLAYISAKNDILSPLAILHQSARSILKGDFSYKIKYDYDTEMGLFCHDFEAMRDELKFLKEKELSIRVNEKELLACLSHDIKTPLTAINGYVSGIKDGIVKDKAGIDTYCLIILNRVKMLSKLLEDILEHSQAELNKMDIKLEEFYCGDYFKDILTDLQVEIESKGLEFIQPKEIPNLLLNGDKKRLSQVMYNLISNSIKYSTEAGTIAISFEPDCDYLHVFIKDTGIGISSADVPFIFNKFFRAEKCRNQNIPGSGLGLSISKYIVEAHGGFISCIESSASGTTICFSLPI